MKKDLTNITPEEAKTICEFYDEPFLYYMTNSDGKWNGLGIAISINTTSTLNGNRYDSDITIYYNGKVRLRRNDGGWNGMREEDINPMITIEYLKLKGYEFKFDIPEKFKPLFQKLERKYKLDQINEIQD